MQTLNNSFFKNKKLIALGDSITNGFDGSHDLKESWPYYLKRLMPFSSIENAGVNAGSITGNTERDLSFQVEHTDFSAFDMVTIFYGTNDFSHSEDTLEIVGRILNQNIQKIRQKNPKIIIFGILPINRFDNGIDNIHIEGLAQYSFQDLLNKLTKIYENNHIPVLNWRKVSPNLLTEQNYYSALGDHRLHPNAATYYQMAETIAMFINANVNKL